MEILNKAEATYPFTNYKLNAEGKKYREIGTTVLKQNKVAVVILAGGQGSRLGSDDPKGCYMLPIGKTLFELHILSVDGVMRLHNAKIYIIIMTSSYTHDAIINFFDFNNYFGVDKDLFVFVQQTECMCFDFDDQPLRDDRGEFVMAPNGNGAVFETLQACKIYDKLPEIEFFNIFSVDNALARIADPVFIGFLVEKKLECASKTVTKLPIENVGVFIKRGNVLLVREYSEIKNNILEDSRNRQSGKLADLSEISEEDQQKGNLTDVSFFDQGNICNHLFTREFMLKAADASLPVHKAIKKISVMKNGKYAKPDKENGYKCELFIFDVFEFSFYNGILNVPREYEFSPIKNGLESRTDNPTTAVNDLQKRSVLMLKIAGVSDTSDEIIIWPNQSVFGENLNKYEDMI